MSLTTSEMTPADIRACTCGNDNGGMWGGDWLAYILLFALLGGGFGGFGGFGGGGILPWLLFANNGFGGFGGGCGVPATQADLAAGFNNSAVLSGINGIDSALCQGFNGLNTAFLQGVNGLERQIADCCCATQRLVERGFAETNYNLATQACDTRNTIQNTTRDIIDNANANSRAILDFLTKDKIDTLQSENLALRFAASQSAQNAFISANQEAQTATLLRRLGAECPSPAYLVNAPTPVTFPVNGCGQVQFGGGCNTGCGGSF